MLKYIDKKNTVNENIYKNTVAGKNIKLFNDKDYVTR
jgi:hypothetical protein